MAIGLSGVQLNIAETSAENAQPLQVDLALAVGEQAAAGVAVGRQEAAIRSDCADAGAEAQQQKEAFQATRAEYLQAIANADQAIRAASADPRGNRYGYYTATMAGRGGRSVMIIQITRGELVDDPEKLAERAQVEAYIY